MCFLRIDCEIFVWTFSADKEEEETGALPFKDLSSCSLLLVFKVSLLCLAISVQC
jgi:hypothetical protein